MAKQEITCDDIIKELKAGQYRPVYYLMGEEPYYIDLLSDYITDNILNETEKEFNLTVMYGADVDVATIINAAKRYPEHTQHGRAFLLPSEAFALYYIGNMPQAWHTGQKEKAGCRNRKVRHTVRI